MSGLYDMGAQFFTALLAPVEVVVFFRGRALHALAHDGVSRGQGLTLVKRLCADLTGMIDSHQTRDVIALCIAQLSLRQPLCRIAALGDVGAPE